MTDIEKIKSLSEELFALCKKNDVIGMDMATWLDKEPNINIQFKRSALNKYEKEFDTVAKEKALNDEYTEFSITRGHVKFYALENENVKFYAPEMENEKSD